MNYLDAVLILTTLLFILLGYKVGFIHTTAALLSLVVPFLLAMFLYEAVAGLINGVFNIRKEWEYPASFFIVYLLSFVLLAILLMKLMPRIRPKLIKSRADKRAGIIPGFIAGFIVSVIIAKAALFSLWNDASSQAETGLISSGLMNASVWVDDYTAPVFSESVPEHLAEASNHEPVADPVQTSVFVIRPDLEAEMLMLVNEERKKYGLKVLELDYRMRTIARAHAADMFLRGYFSHDTPEGKTPFDRMETAGVQYSWAGENLACSASVLRAHTGLMHSPGHRENLLSPKYGRLGIGIQDGGKKGLMIAQEFRN